MGSAQWLSPSASWQEVELRAQSQLTLDVVRYDGIVHPIGSFLLGIHEPGWNDDVSLG